MLKRFSILLIFLCLAFSARASIDIDQTQFGQIPVLHEGRLKPLQRMAEVSLQQISDNAYHAQSPINWLALLLFQPAETQDLAMFHVDNTDVIELLNLPKNPQSLYTYQELAVVLSQQAKALQALTKRPGNELNRDEKSLVRVLENIALYQQLTHAFSMVTPLAIAPNDLGLSALHIINLQSPITYLQLQKYQRLISGQAHLLAKKPSKKLSDQDFAAARLAQILDGISSGGQNNDVLRILPSAWQQNGETWITPWQALQGQGGPATADALQQWQAMLLAYQAKDLSAFNHAVSGWQNSLQQNKISPVSQLRWQAERLYLAWPWLLGAGIAYLLGLIGLCYHSQRNTAQLGGQNGNGFPQWRVRMTTYFTCLILAVGILQHAAALGLRMEIMGRPPVSNLYESIIFVAFVAVIFGVFAQFRQRLNILLIPSLAIALILLAINQFFIGDGDNLSPLIAVLNTKFWLATHVVCITLGYTACLLAAAYAHLLLFRNAWQRVPLELKILKPLLHISLLLTVTGTLLGGIWADQSWGRFWGWDPKENGALLITVWLLWLQHGAVAGQLKNFGLAAGTALLAPIVALSWFGVNLLGVGLHSYGFSSQTAWGLFIFIAVEILLVAGLAWRQNKL